MKAYPDTPDLTLDLAEMAQEIREDQRMTVEAYAQQLRAEADAILAKHGIAIRQRALDAVLEVEAC